MSTSETKMNGLQELGGSNYEMADGQEDIRGWDVRNAAGNRLGDVDELLFDEVNQKIRYIVLDMDDNEVELSDRKVLIPIGLAELHEKDDDVILNTVTNEQLESLAEYDKDDFESNGDKMNLSVFAGSDALENQNDRYQSNHFDDSKLYRNRLMTRDSQSEIPENVTNDEETINQNRRSGISLKSKERLF